MVAGDLRDGSSMRSNGGPLLAAAIGNARTARREGAADLRLGGIGRLSLKTRHAIETRTMQARRALIRSEVYGWRGARNSSIVGALSTTRPAYMTTMRSASPATTPRSWLMSTMDIPDCARTSRSNVRGSAPARSHRARWWARRRSPASARTSGSCRSSRAGACLRTVRAGTGAGGAAHRAPARARACRARALASLHVAPA
jgi:hypothetical protein